MIGVGGVVVVVVIVLVVEFCQEERGCCLYRLCCCGGGWARRIFAHMAIDDWDALVPDLFFVSLVKKVALLES